MMALRLIALDSYILPRTAALHVSAHVNDRELQAALDTMGASRGPTGQSTIKGYAAMYQHRILPPRERSYKKVK